MPDSTHFTHELVLDESPLQLKEVKGLVFGKTPTRLSLPPTLPARLAKSETHLHRYLDEMIPIYGVTTGFGGNASQLVVRERSVELQNNLISYLSCATGPILPREVARAALFFRLRSISRGFSAVSFALIERLQLFLNNDWTPVIPREGSLGASGDLVPLAYVAQAIQGQGMLLTKNGVRPASQVLKEAGVEPYVLKPKEGLALVNGTSVMAAYGFYNLERARFVSEMALLATSWLCMALRGRTEAFSELVNEKANTHRGQSQAAKCIRDWLAEENYFCDPIRPKQPEHRHNDEVIQDQYSLRCVPQILGPILETLDQAERWIETEMNGTSDNPLFDEEGGLAMGGNFYGGYISHGMDYLKISLAHIADLLDRQLMLLCNDKTNRGLPPNLADWDHIPEQDRFLHHGLKGLHQSVSAITSEIMARSIPNGIFSRSAESHNQDKVSLGMSAASQCSDLLDALYNVLAMSLICGAQALDLRKIQLKGKRAQTIYKLVRSLVPRVTQDTALGDCISVLSNKLQEVALYEKT